MISEQQRLGMVQGKQTHICPHKFQYQLQMLDMFNNQYKLIRIMEMKKNLIQNSNEPINSHSKDTISNKYCKEMRTSEKILYKNQWRRKTIIPSLPHMTVLPQHTNLERQYFNQYSKVKEQFDLQASLKSQYIVRNFQMENQKKKIIIIQEYYDLTLAELPLEKLNFIKRLKIFYSIAKGVRDLQDNFICHRSLNPEHICLIQEGQEMLVKINYFQSALKLDCFKCSISTAAAGMKVINKEIDEFSSPEIRYGRSHGMMADIWSLGAILNYLLYETIKNIWEEEKEFKVEVPEGTPVWLFELLKLMLHYHPQNRHSLVTILDIIRVSMKCADVMGKFIPVGNKSLKFKKQQTKLNNCSDECL